MRLSQVTYLALLLLLLAVHPGIAQPAKPTMARCSVQNSVLSRRVRPGGNFVLTNDNKRICVVIQLILEKSRHFRPNNADLTQIRTMISRALQPLLNRLESAGNMPQYVNRITFYVGHYRNENRAEAEGEHQIEFEGNVFRVKSRVYMAHQFFVRARTSSFEKRGVSATILHEVLHTFGISSGLWRLEIKSGREGKPTMRKWEYKDRRLGYKVYRPQGRASAAVREYNRMYGINVDFVPLQNGGQSHPFTINAKRGEPGYDPARNSKQGKKLPGLAIDVMGGSAPGATLTNLSLGFLEDLGFRVRYFRPSELPRARCFYEHPGNVTSIGVPYFFDKQACELHDQEYCVEAYVGQGGERCSYRWK